MESKICKYAPATEGRKKAVTTTLIICMKGNTGITWMTFEEKGGLDKVVV